MIKIMTRKGLRKKIREAEKYAYRLAFAKFKEADKVSYGNQQVLRGKTVKKKIVILGDEIFVMNNLFLKDGKLEIR